MDMIGRDRMPGWAWKGIDSYEVSIPAPMVMLGLDTTPDLQTHHTFCYSDLEEMNNLWYRDYLNNQVPAGGFMLISWPSMTDTSMAPKGHHCLNLVSFCPYDLTDGKDWEQEDYRQWYLDMILDVMEDRFNLDLKSHITFKKLIDPKTFQKRYLHPRGAVYGLQNDMTCTAMFRPKMKSPIFKNLYLAGASVHLGGGVPVTTGSGICVGDLIKKDHKL